MSPNIDAEFIHRTLVRLVQTNSINPLLDPASPGEGEVARFIAATLDEIGLESQTSEPEPGRVSVTGTLRGTGGGRSLMLNAHIDTVGVDRVFLGSDWPYDAGFESPVVWINSLESLLGI